MRPIHEAAPLPESALDALSAANINTTADYAAAIGGWTVLRRLLERAGVPISVTETDSGIDVTLAADSRQEHLEDIHATIIDEFRNDTVSDNPSKAQCADCCAPYLDRFLQCLVCDTEHEPLAEMEA